MIQPLANIVSAPSYISWPLDSPVLGLHPSWGPTVLLGILQAQPDSPGWLEGSPALFLPTKVLQLEIDVAEAPAS